MSASADARKEAWRNRERAEAADDPQTAEVYEESAKQWDALADRLAESEAGDKPSDGGGVPNFTNPAEQIKDAVSKLEEATVEAVEAAAEAGEPERAQTIAARTVEGLGSVVAELEDLGEAVEEAAEEVAEEAAPESPAAEAAEAAVETAQEAQEATEEAEAAVREEVRELGGEGEVRAAAAEAQVAEVVEEVAETAEPVEAAMVEPIAEPDAPIAPAPEPELIRPAADHPYFRRRSFRLFGKQINL